MKAIDDDDNGFLDVHELQDFVDRGEETFFAGAEEGVLETKQLATAAPTHVNQQMIQPGAGFVLGEHYLSVNEKTVIVTQQTTTVSSSEVHTSASALDLLGLKTTH